MVFVPALFLDFLLNQVFMRRLAADAIMAAKPR
jgi:hypothetical protein